MTAAGITERAAADRAAPVPIRTSVAADATPWRVYEFADLGGDRLDRSLIFESDCLFRRVRSYPRRWYALPVPELAALIRAR